MIEIGKQYRLAVDLECVNSKYHDEFEHYQGQVVTVESLFESGTFEDGREWRVYAVRAADGWTDQVDEDELLPPDDPTTEAR